MAYDSLGNSITLKNITVGPNGSLLNAGQLGPTVIPLLFSFVVPMTLWLLARWKAQEGAKLGTLEVLIGSRSLASTIGNIVHLRLRSLMPLGLLALWASSPLASQASLRALYRYSVTDHSIQVRWQVFNTMSYGPWSSPPAPGFTALQVEALYLGALSQGSITLSENSTGVAQFDVNGFPLVPMTMGSETWTCWEDEVGDLTCPPTRWASLVEIPTYGPFKIDIRNFSSTSYPFSATANFTVSVPLFELNCPNSLRTATTNSSWLSLLPRTGQFASNETLLSQAHDGSGFFFGTDAVRDQREQEVLFGSFSPSNVTIWHCHVSLATRNITTQCFDPDFWGFPPRPYTCSYVSASPPLYSSTTILPTLNMSLSHFWAMVDPPFIGASSRTENFLAYGNASYAYDSKFTEPIDLSLVTSELMFSRLTTVFNTFWLASTTPRVDAPMPYPLMNATWTTQTLFDSFDVVRCHWLYLIFLLLVSIALVACSCLNAWLRYHIKTPDVLGYVSSIVNDEFSSQTGFEGHRACTGLDRTRALQDLRLKVEESGKTTTYWE